MDQAVGLRQEQIQVLQRHGEREALEELETQSGEENKEAPGFQMCSDRGVLS